MKTTYKALRAACLLAALIPFSVVSFAADPAKPQDSAAPAPETPLHEIGASAPAVTPAPAAPAAPTAAAAPATPVVPAAPAQEPAARHRHGHGDDSGNDRVSVGDSTYVGPEETVEGNAVAIMGPVTVDGTVNGNAVAVLGDNKINGTVHGNAVAVLGTMRLGPKARVDGNVVAAAGTVIKEPGAIVGGNVVQQNHGLDFSEDSGAASWWKHGLRMGRPLAIGPHLHFFWILNICLVAIYILLALVFPNGVRKCGDTLVQRPGITFLTGILAILGLPVLFVLLLITIVGIPVALIVLPLSVMAAVMFGKTAIYALVGRSILGKEQHPAVTLILGVIILMALYLIPFLGLAMWIFVAFLGFGCALTTLFTSGKGTPTPPAVVPPVVAPPAAAAPPPVSASAAVPLAAAMPLATTVPVAAVAPAAAPQDTAPAARQAPVAETVPPVVSASAAHVSEAGLPRAGFWIRMVALLIDVLLVGIVTQMHSMQLFFVALVLYGALLWKLRGATIGGIIFGLKVVRADGQPMEWVTVVVRALGCFFSLVVIGLGFIWIALDPEKQGWHDKIAGTVVVRLSKGVSLV